MAKEAEESERNITAATEPAESEPAEPTEYDNGEKNPAETSSTEESQPVEGRKRCASGKSDEPAGPGRKREKRRESAKRANQRTRAGRHAKTGDKFDYLDKMPLDQVPHPFDTSCLSVETQNYMDCFDCHLCSITFADSSVAESHFAGNKHLMAVKEHNLANPSEYIDYREMINFIEETNAILQRFGPPPCLLEPADQNGWIPAPPPPPPLPEPRNQLSLMGPNSTELHCALCLIDFTDVFTGRTHFYSRRHLKALLNLEDELRLVMAGFQQNETVVETPAQGEVASFAANSDGSVHLVLNMVGNHCYPCDLNSISFDEMKQHLAGEDHLERVKSLAESGRRYVNNSPVPGAGTENMPAPTDDDDDPLRCRLCDVQFESENEKTQHPQSQQHQDNESNKELDHFYNRQHGHYYCDLCDIRANTRESFRLHYDGSKHSNSLNMLAAGAAAVSAGRGGFAFAPRGFAGAHGPAGFRHGPPTRGPGSSHRFPGDNRPGHSGRGNFRPAGSARPGPFHGRSAVRGGFGRGPMRGAGRGSFGDERGARGRGPRAGGRAGGVGMQADDAAFRHGQRPPVSAEVATAQAQWQHKSDRVGNLTIPSADLDVSGYGYGYGRPQSSSGAPGPDFYGPPRQTSGPPTLNPYYAGYATDTTSAGDFSAQQFAYTSQPASTSCPPVSSVAPMPVSTTAGIASPPGDTAYYQQQQHQQQHQQQQQQQQWHNWFGWNQWYQRGTEPSAAAGAPPGVGAPAAAEPAVAATTNPYGQWGYQPGSA